MATTINPYTANLNLSDQTGITLFNKGAEALSTKFDSSLKNLQPFLAELRTLAFECNWQDVLMVADAGAVNRNLLTEHGFLTQMEVHVGIIEQENIAADVNCTAANTQAVICSQMMHKCIKEGLTLAYLKTCVNILPSCEQDGPKLIYYIITNTHIESILLTCDPPPRPSSLDLKKFGYNIKKMHAEVDHLVAQFKVNKSKPDDLTIMMHIIAAYRTNLMNTQFLQNVSNLDDWSRGIIMTSTQLRT